MTPVLCQVLSERSDRARAVNAARWILRMRRRRTLSLPWLEGLLGEPAWEMVLDLFVAGSVGRTVVASAASSLARVPHSTASRWLDLLEAKGIVDSDENADRTARVVYLTPRVEMEVERMLTCLFDRDVDLAKQPAHERPFA